MATPSYLANGTQTQYTLISNVSATTGSLPMTVSGVTVINPGVNYNYAPQILINSADGNGVGAQAVATLNANGTIANITVTNQGTGYTSTPTVVIRDASTGSLGTIIIENGGGGYSNTPTVIIGSPNNPTGQQAYAVVGLAQNSLNNVLVTNNGTGYTQPPSVLVSAAQNNYPSVGAQLVAVLNTGSGAAATAQTLPYYTGDYVEGSSYYLRTGSMQTVMWDTSNTFTGNIYLQGSLSANADVASWFDIQELSYVPGTTANVVGQQTVIGNFKWLRARVQDFAAGTINTLTITYPYNN